MEHLQINWNTLSFCTISIKKAALKGFLNILKQLTNITNNGFSLMFYDKKITKIFSREPVKWLRLPFTDAKTKTGNC